MSQPEPFLDYLAEVFMRNYHGDKEHYESAFESWLENLEVADMIEHGNRAMGAV